MQRERRARFITAALILILDQTLKFLFYNRQLIKEKLTLIKNLFYLVPASENQGIAFGLFQNYGRFFIVSTSIIILFIVFLYLHTEKEKTLFHWGLILILTGASSNLIDRIIYGFVLDYLLLNKFPYSFNIADVSILAGVGLIIIKVIKDSRYKKLDSRC